MSANSFGERFRFTSFGESHGPALGAVIEGCPAGVIFDESLLRRELARRRPGQSSLTTSRRETDEPEVLSGVFEGKTLGTPIAVMIRNTDQRSEDYKNISPRPGHADDVWKEKFTHSDPRGGGRASGRETVNRVIAGAFAQMVVRTLAPEARVVGFTARVGDIELTTKDRDRLKFVDVDSFPARFPSERVKDVEAKIMNARETGDSLGGVGEIQILNPPKGLGQPVFRKLKADLASAFMSIGATSAVEIGDGIHVSDKSGTEFHSFDRSDVYGGVRGGISTGETIRVRVHFKPTSSVLDIAKKGRHDPFIVTRAVPVLEAMAWVVIADHLLWMKTDRI